jgi:hypothetical protein
MSSPARTVAPWNIPAMPRVVRLGYIYAADTARAWGKETLSTWKDTLGVIGIFARGHPVGTVNGLNRCKTNAECIRPHAVPSVGRSI